MSDALRNTLQISTRIIYDEIKRRGISIDILDAHSSLLEYTTSQDTKHFLFSTNSDKSSATGVIIADNKTRTALVAKRLGIPLPAQANCHNIRDIREFLAIHKQIVIKPPLGSGGKGVSTNLTTNAEVEKAYHYAKNYNHTVIAQEHIEGEDIRLLVVGGIFCSALIRKPASVLGDGVSTIRELIDKENASGSRFDNSMSALSLIDISSAKRYLADKFDSVPLKDSTTAVIGPANLSRGGSAHEATHLVTGEMITDAERMSSKLRLGICGVDMMWNRTTNKYYLIEVNATPGINMHNDPFWGTSSDAIERYVTWLLDPSKQMPH